MKQEKVYGFGTNGLAYRLKKGNRVKRIIEPVKKVKSWKDEELEKPKYWDIEEEGGIL